MSDEYTEIDMQEVRERFERVLGRSGLIIDYRFTHDNSFAVFKDHDGYEYQIPSSAWQDDDQIRASMNQQIRERDEINLKYHRGMVEMLEARLTEPPVERIEGYEPVPPYAPKFIATEQGWFVVDSNGVPVMGQWNNNSDTEPPSSLLETLADLNK